MWRRFGLGGLLAVLLLSAVAGWRLFVWAPWEVARTGYHHVIPQADRVIGGVDHHVLHREHFAAASVEATQSDALAAIARLTAPDPGLTLIGRALSDALVAGDGAAAEDAAGTWNAALEARGAPWAIQTGKAGRSVYVKSLWIAATPLVVRGQQQATVRLGLRQDQLNIVESWLGLAESVGTTSVVADRVVTFAADALWPLLDPQSTHPHAKAVTAWATGLLPPDALRELSRMAASRDAMVAARDEMASREQRCRARFAMKLRWDGIDDVGQLRGWADALRYEACPSVTFREADAIVKGTLRIRRKRGVPDALTALVAGAARHVVLHEGQHALDRAAFGFGVPPPCEGCGRMGEGTRSEASAYLAALASDEAVIAFVQACGVADAGGASGAALRGVFEALDVSCSAEPPADLAARAAAIEEAWFGRTERLRIEGPFPATLPLERGL